jgi:glycerol-3-phosphate dehydrogenase (NAD(P)+)
MIMVAEGVPTAKSVHQLAMKHKIDMPLASEVYQVLYEGKDASQAILDVMMRDARAER